jgi:hypothetical protein
MTNSKRILGGLAVAVTAMTVSLSPAAAQASDLPGILCRTNSPTPVFRGSDWNRIYTIDAGRDMRVHWQDGSYFYGHGNGHTVDGYAHTSHFDWCRG